MEQHYDLTVEGVRATVAALMGLAPASLGTNDNLLEIGVDSIKLMALASQWQRQGVEVPFGKLAEQPTVAGWSRLLLNTAALNATPRRRDLQIPAPEG